MHLVSKHFVLIVASIILCCNIQQVVAEQHCGTSFYPHSCWKECTGGGWCWTEESKTCYHQSDCSYSASCYKFKDGCNPNLGG
ncbi:hypothetical protein F5H01DRAFT_353734, partial [Linnemannia elongata]